MLKYIGDGAFHPPYPARDLTDGEVKEFGEAELLKTGLYQKDNGALPKADKATVSKKVANEESES